MKRCSFDTLSKIVKLLLRDPRDFFRKSRRFLRPMRRDYRRRFNMKLSKWLLYHQREIVFDKCRWMGVPAQKNPLDAWVYQEILHEVQPDVVIEIGSAEGGSTIFLAHMLDLIGKGTIISVDIDRSRFNLEHDRLVAITGDSSSPQVVEQVRRLCRDKSVLVIHDGGHTKQQVLKDLECYAPLVSVNSYFIVEDGIVDLYRPGDGLGSFDDGPLSAVEEFISRNPTFIIDAEREKYILTYSPRGFLKRIG